MNEKLTIEIECPSCGGHGIYQGMAERDGAFVVCKSCKGTGRSTYSYAPFTERRVSTKCERVYQSGCLYINNGTDVVTEDGKSLPFGTVGCTYKDWLNGVKPKPITFVGCPMLVDQGACNDIDGFVDECSRINDGYVGYIPNCAGQSDTDRCWKRFNFGQVC